MHPFTHLVTSNLRAINAPVHASYEAMLDHAVVCSPPPFCREWFGRRYFELARQPDWFANSLIANAALEGYGSQQIWKFADKVGERSWEAAVREHALDESRHSTMFVKMLRLVFPGAKFDEATELAVDALQPKFTRRTPPPISRVDDDEALSGEALLNELVQVHITEIRALVLQFLLRPVLLAYAPEAHRRQLFNFTAILVRDEARHIEYTAKIFDDAAAAGSREFLFQVFEDRLKDFNDLTMVELERENISL